MKLILLLSFCAVVFTVPTPMISHLAYKKVSDLEPGKSFKDWLSTGFTKMDKPYETNVAIFVKCDDKSKLMKISTRNNIMDGLIMDIKNGKLVNPYGDVKMTCVDLADWKKGNVGYCTLGKELKRPLIQTDYTLHVGNGESYKCACATKDDITSPITEKCNNGVMTHDNCSDIAISNGRFCSTSWLGRSVRVPDIRAHYVAAKQTITAQCYKNKANLTVDCNSAGNLIYLDEKDPWNGCSYPCEEKDYKGNLLLGERHYDEDNDYLLYDHKCPPTMAFKNYGRVTCSEHFDSNSVCAPGCDHPPIPVPGVTFPESCNSALEGDVCQYTCPNGDRPSGKLQCKDNRWVGSPKCNSCCAALPVIANAFVGKSCECTPEGEPCTDVNCVANYESNFRVPFCISGKWVINTWCYPQIDAKEVDFWNKNHTTIFSSALSVGIVAVIVVITIITCITCRSRKNAYKGYSRLPTNDDVDGNSVDSETFDNDVTSNVPSASSVTPAIPTEADKGTDNYKDTVTDNDGNDGASLKANGDKTNDDSTYY